MEYVPEEQTYLLDKGERVLSPKQNKDLTKFLANKTNSNGGIVIQGLSVSIMEKEDTTSQEQADEIGKAIKESLKSMITSELEVAQRPGNLHNPTTTSTVF